MSPAQDISEVWWFLRVRENPGYWMYWDLLIVLVEMPEKRALQMIKPRTDEDMDKSFMICGIQKRV